MTPPHPDDVPTFDAETEAELDAAAEITPEDIQRAQETWREVAPRNARGLLDAEPADNDDAT
jgi:hypothetical protein